MTTPTPQKDPRQTRQPFGSLRRRRRWLLGKWSPLAAAALLAGGAVQSIVAQPLWTFDSSDDLSSGFLEAGVTAGQQYFWTDESGVGGVSGMLRKGLDYNETLLVMGGYSFGINESLGISTFFRAGPFPVRPNYQYHAVGWVDAKDHGLYARPDYSYLAVSLAEEPEGGSGRRLLAHSVTPEGSLSAASPVFAVTSGWYELAANWSLAGTDTVAYQTQLLYRGADGTDSPTLVASLNGFFLNPTLAQSPTVFAGVNFFTLDNFSVLLIPEPNVWVLFLTALLVIAQFARSRSRRTGRGGPFPP